MKPSFSTLVQRTARLRNAVILLAAFSAPLAGCSKITGIAQVRRDIRGVIEKQAECWNVGDLEGYMEAYWKSGRLSFNADGVIYRGWDNTFDRYRRRYPDPEAMGHLKLDRIEVNELSEDVAYVIGRWYLGKDQPTGGTFTLVLVRKGGDWVIVHDHTSTVHDAQPDGDG